MNFQMRLPESLLLLLSLLDGSAEFGTEPRHEPAKPGAYFTQPSPRTLFARVLVPGSGMPKPSETILLKGRCTTRTGRTVARPFPPFTVPTHYETHFHRRRVPRCRLCVFGGFFTATSRNQLRGFMGAGGGSAAGGGAAGSAGGAAGAPGRGVITPPPPPPPPPSPPPPTTTMTRPGRIRPC